MRISLVAVLAVVATLVAPASAYADHPAPNLGTLNGPISTGVNAGGEGADWSLITTLFTGNPHTDLDFFEVDGDFYVAVGTLAVGLNAGGVTIHRLTVDGAIDPDNVSAVPTAACLADPSRATALQHDVEVTPKGDVLFNTDWGGLVDTSRPQLIIDATDGAGRCHDQVVAVAGRVPGTPEPNGGLEIIDITDLDNPAEIALTRHLGQAHTTNVDPRRAHIAYAVTSDTSTISTRTTADNINGGSQTSLDGFEMVDLSSCMNFPDGTDIAAKRDACRPSVYRFRFDPDWTRGTGNAGAIDTNAGCHELEVYPDDRLVCAAANGTVVLDMSGAFDDNGTPDDYTDDTVNGDPLPCDRIPSPAVPPFTTGAMVTDCVTGAGGQPLTIGGWIEVGEPSVEGVEVVGWVNHNGRTLNNSAADSRPPDEDIAVSHEAEFTESGRYVLVTDERGGGVVPGDSACEPSQSNPVGNGGIHAYVVDQLHTAFPGDPATDSPADIATAADSAYARTPDGGKAIHRTTPRVVSAAFCTAHVMQLIPGQNRIFMGWYSQGTQVVDFIEHPDGTFEWIERAWFVPEGAETWTSHIWAFEENADGSFTYYGATGDLARTATDIYSVTLSAPPEPRIDPVVAPPAPPPPPPAVTEPPAPLPTTGGGAIALAMGALALAGTMRRRRS